MNNSYPKLVEVPFYDDTLQATRQGDKVLVVIKRVTEVLGLGFSPQLIKLKTKPWATVGLCPMVAPDGKIHKMACIPIDALPMWLATIDPERVAPNLRAKLEKYQTEAVKTLHDYFHSLAPVREGENLPPAEAEKEEEVTGTPVGLTRAVVGGVNLYTGHADPEVVTVRDLDLGERAGLARPRKIRETIIAAIEDGAILDASEQRPHEGAVSETAPWRPHGGAISGNAPRAWRVPATYTRGNGSTGVAEEWHLNETAVIVVLARLRTAKAAMAQRAIAEAIVLLRRGRHEEAARVVGGPTPAPAQDRVALAFAQIDQLFNEGTIDRRTWLDQRTLIIREFCGIDLTKAPRLTYERADTVTQATEALAPGEQVTLTKLVDVRDHLSASAIGQSHKPPLSATVVAQVARAIGIHGAPGWGRSAPVIVNGQRRSDAWYYSPAAVDRLRPVLAKAAALHVGRMTWEQAIADAVNNINAKEMNP